MSLPIPGLRALGRRFFCDERGAVSVIGALLLSMGIAVSVLVIDTGHLYLAKRRLQSAVDAAALGAAGDISDANSIAATILTRDGYTATATVQTGVYSADSSISVGARFNAGGTGQPDAVRVSKTVSVSTILAGAIGAQTLSQVSATATAARISTVSFAAGTGLATLDGGTLNSMLGGLLGTTLSLSLVNYQALAATNVDALTFLDQLASQAGVTAGTYGDLANTSVTMGQMMAAARAALNIQGGNNSAALDALNLISVQTPAAVTAAFGKLVDTTLWQKRQIGSIVQQTPGRTTLNLFDLTSATARIYGAGHLITLGSAISLIPGTSVTTRMAIGSPMTSIAVGKVGTTISTSQVRLAFKITQTINLVVATLPVTLPVYLQIASGQASVAAIPCTSGGVLATLSAASQAGVAGIGSVSDSDLVNFANDPPVQPASLVTLSISLPLLPTVQVTILGSGSLSIAAGAQTDEDFTQADIDNGTVKTAAGSDAGHVFSGLTPTLSFSGGGLPGAVTTLLNNTVLPALRPALAILLTALDPVVDTTLRTLGLRLGTIDTVVHGVGCGVPTLVQ